MFDSFLDPPEASEPKDPNLLARAVQYCGRAVEAVFDKVGSLSAENPSEELKKELHHDK